MDGERGSSNGPSVEGSETSAAESFNERASGEGWMDTTDVSRPPEDDFSEDDITDIVDKRMFRFGKYLQESGGGIVDESVGNQFASVVWEMAHTAMSSLRHYIESPMEPEISWESPWVEARWPVAWDWDRDEPCFFAFERSDFEGELDDVAIRLGRRVGDLVRGFTLHFLTHRVIFKKKGERVESWLPVCDLESLAKVDEDSREYFNRLIEKPITIFGDATDPESSIAQAELADGTVRLERCSAAQVTITATEDDGKRVLGSAYPIVQFHPLVVDEIERVAYFPMVAAVVVDAQMANSDLLHSSEWSDLFWKVTLELLEAKMREALRPAEQPPDNHLPTDVSEALQEDRVVVVPKVAESQGEVVRKVRGFALKLAGTVELTGKVEVDQVDAALRRREVPRVPIPPGVAWSQLSIVFTASDTVRIEVSGRFSRVYTFGELGFRDNRTQGYPNTRWVLLRTLAENGEISWERPPEKLRQDQVKAAVADLRAHLKKLFNIDADPFEDYRKVKAYRTRFALRMDERLRDGGGDNQELYD